jgi:signal peptidase I
VFSDPGGWAQRVSELRGGTPVAPTFIKRVVGMPGERVACCDDDGRITIDGDPLIADHRADQGSGALASVLAFDIVVPHDAVFVLGDNRGASVDSRYLGAVPLDAVLGIERLVVPLP